MLRPDLKESDIPGRTTLYNQVLEILQEHLDLLEDDMKV